MNRRITDDEILTLLAGLFFAPAIALALIPGLASTVGGWLTAHQVLVRPAAGAVFTLPGLDAGPDGRRVVIVVLLLAAAALAAWGWRARRDLA
jgi:hypothetical protein